MQRVALTISTCVLALGLAACDKGGDKSAEAKTEDKKEDAKKEEAAKQDEKAAPAPENKQPEPVPDDTKGMGGVIHAAAGDEKPAAPADPAAPTDAAAPADGAAPTEAAAPAAPPEAAAKDAAANSAAPVDAPHFDTSKDKGSMLGHLASSIVHDDNLAAAKDAMSTLASLAIGDTTPSDAEICGHVWTQVFVKEFGETADEKLEAEFMEMCEFEIEKERLKLGPEVFGEAAACIMAAESMEAIEACDKAEQEAEEELHENPHGDGIDKATCEAAVKHMFDLMRKDIGQNAELLELLEADLENLQADAVIMCMDEATKAEIDCLMKADSLEKVEACD